MDAGAVERELKRLLSWVRYETMVVFEEEGVEPKELTKTWAVTSVTYEEDLAGTIVIRGRLLPVPGPEEDEPPAAERYGITDEEMREAGI